MALTLELCSKKANEKGEETVAGNMVRKLLLEIRKRLCGYVVGKPLVVMLSVVT